MLRLEAGAGELGADGSVVLGWDLVSVSAGSDVLVVGWAEVVCVDTSSGVVRFSGAAASSASADVGEAARPAESVSIAHKMMLRFELKSSGFKVDTEPYEGMLKILHSII